MQALIGYMKAVRFQYAACWAHVRRRFFDLARRMLLPYPRKRFADRPVVWHRARDSGRSPDERRQIRQVRTLPLLDQMQE
jgi:hypothetical protein